MRVYRVMVRLPGDEWEPWTKVGRSTPRFYSRLGFAKSAAAQIPVENSIRERQGLPLYEHRIEETETSWEPVDG